MSSTAEMFVIYDPQPILKLNQRSQIQVNMDSLNETLEATMTQQISLNTLWDSATSSDRVFQPDDYTHLPEAARRYLDHAIALQTPLASAVRLCMHGEIKLKKWIPFNPHSAGDGVSKYT